MAIDLNQEIKLNWNNDLLEADLTYLDGDLDTEQGLTSAVYISLFTDRRASEDDILPDLNDNDLRGWWGDLIQTDTELETDQIGSLLWLLERSKTTPDIIIRAKRYCEEALQWLVDDDICSEVEVQTERQGAIGNDRLAISVKAKLINGTLTEMIFSKSLSEGGN